MVLKDLMGGTTLLIETSPDSKWIFNEYLEKLLGLNLKRISSWDFKS
jgi:hypothetical protein